MSGLGVWQARSRISPQSFAGSALVLSPVLRVIFLDHEAVPLWRSLESGQPQEFVFQVIALYPEEKTDHFRLDQEEVAEGRGAFLVCYRNGQPGACGAIRRLGADGALGLAQRQVVGFLALFDHAFQGAVRHVGVAGLQ